jgi:hypothetical protein
LEFVERQDLIDHVDPVQYTIRLLIPPGSLLLSRPAMRPFLGPLDGAALSYPWMHPDPRMDALHRNVRALVEEATGHRADVVATFDRVRRLAATHAERAPRQRALRRLPPERPTPARLTEPWFC